VGGCIANLEVRELQKKDATRNDNVLAQSRIMCICNLWARVYNVGDIQLLFQPAGHVCIDGEAGDKFSRGAYGGGGDAPPWQGTTHIACVILEAMISVYSIEHAKPRRQHRCSPSGGYDPILDSIGNLLFFVAGHTVDAHGFEEPALLIHFQVHQCDVSATMEKLRKYELNHGVAHPNCFERLTFVFLSRRFLARLVASLRSLPRRFPRKALMRDLIYAWVFLSTMRRTAQTSGYTSVWVLRKSSVKTRAAEVFQGQHGVPAR